MKQEDAPTTFDSPRDPGDLVSLGPLAAPSSVDSDALGRLLESVGAPDVMAALGDLVDAAVFVVDGQRNIVFWSKGAERLLGYRSEEVVGEYCLKANRCVSCMKGCGISEHGEIRNVPLRMYKSDGEVAPIRKSGRAFFDDRGRFVGGVEVLRLDPNLGADLSTAASVGERTRIEQALEEANGHVGKAAEILGISRATLWRKRKRYNL